MIILFCIFLFILFFYNKIKNTENFVYKTELACIDSCILNKINIHNTCSYNDMNCKHFKCSNYCKLLCENDVCIYKKNIDLEKSPPETIDKPVIKFFKDYINLSWFKPVSSIKHPVLEYIIFIESADNINNTKTIQFVKQNDSELVEHNITGLENNKSYNLKIFAVNSIGKSKPYELNNLFYPSKNIVINNNIISSNDNNNDNDKTNNVNILDNLKDYINIKKNKINFNLVLDKIK